MKGGRVKPSEAFQYVLYDLDVTATMVGIWSARPWAQQ
jgi:hypothetical protein